MCVPYCEAAVLPPGGGEPHPGACGVLDPGENEMDPSGDGTNDCCCLNCNDYCQNMGYISGEEGAQCPMAGYMLIAGLNGGTCCCEQMCGTGAGEACNGRDYGYDGGGLCNADEDSVGPNCCCGDCCR